MTAGQRMKLKRKELGLSAEYLAEKLGLSPATIYRYENGDIEKVPGNILQPLCRILNTSPAYLMGWEDEAAYEQELCPAVPIYQALNQAGRSEYIRYGRYLTGQSEYQAAGAVTQVEYIRHYLTAAAAGYAAPIEGEDYELIPKDAQVPARADFCIDIDGDSMEPYIKDGQRVYVQRGADLREFEVGIFFVDGDMYCKQWCSSYDGSLYLLSANPRRQDANITISRDGGRTCVCFGKVLLPHKLPQPNYI